MSHDTLMTTYNHSFKLKQAFKIRTFVMMSNELFAIGKVEFDDYFFQLLRTI